MSDDEPEPRSEIIEISYGHPSGAVQAAHPESNTKQLGGSPAEAVEQLWSLLRQGGVVDD